MLSIPGADGGSWFEGEIQGQYCVIIVDRSFDHIVSKLYLQWLNQESEESLTTIT